MLGSGHKMNVGGNAVTLDGDKSYVHNKETIKKTRINYEQGQRDICVWVPAKEGEVAKETEKVLTGNCFAILPTERFVRNSPGGRKRRKSTRR